MTIKFCELCGSMETDNMCSNYRCKNSNGKKLKAGHYSTSSEFQVNPKNGKLRDKETGTIVQGG